MGKLNVEKTKQSGASEETGSGFNYYTKIFHGENIWLLCPPHDDMDGVPWVKTVKHFNVGPNNKVVNCRRWEKQQPVEDCAVCNSVYPTIWAEDFKSLPQDEQRKFNMKARKVQYRMNIIDLTPLFEKTKAIPDCFGYFKDENHLDNVEQCNGCPFNNAIKIDDKKTYGGSCKNFIQVATAGVTVQKGIRNKINLYGDITDLEHPQPVVIIKEGSGINTDYQVEMAPPHVTEAITEFLSDASVREDIEAAIPNLDVPEFTGIPTLEDQNRIMEGLTEASESAPNANIKPCFGKYSIEKEECKDCIQLAACIDEAEEGETAEPEPKPPARSGKKASGKKASGKKSAPKPVDSEEDIPF